MGIFQSFRKKQSDEPVAVAKSSAPVRTDKKPEEELNAKKQPVVKGSGRFANVLRHPLVTEKAAMLGEHGTYCFVVAPTTTKGEIRKAVAETYGVHPISIRTLSHRGKNVRYGKTKGRTNRWKKAIVTLKKGETIKIYEGV